jgi:choice-of-anchor B domain-containing protein
MSFAILVGARRVSSHVSGSECLNGFAGAFPCSQVDLLAQLSLAELGNAGSAADIWGWTDPMTGIEYALVALDIGTAFIDLSDPGQPLYLGLLPSAGDVSSVRDVKVLGNSAYITSEASGHGLQAFDLTGLRSPASIPMLFAATANYNQVGRAHNIVINETASEGYIVGSLEDGRDCAGGLHIIDLTLPLSPTFRTCFSQDGYTHDAQCLSYHGTDLVYQGNNICFSFNKDTLTIVDVTDEPIQISRTGYAGWDYTHQGWLSEDQRFLVMNDEGDEPEFGHNTRTRVWDVGDLDAPVVIGVFDGPNPSVDHNLYLRDGYVFSANYSSGLQILDAGAICQGQLTLAAYFDTYPADDAVAYSGAWSAYPFFESGIVIVSSIGEGLFVLQPELGPPNDAGCPSHYYHFPLITNP